MACCSKNDENDYDEKKLKNNIRLNRNNRRSCTDCLCFLFFIIFLIGMGAMTTLTVLDDGFDRLIYGFDSFGNICNRKNTVKTQNLNYNGWDTTDYKSVLFLNYLNPLSSHKVCVKSCPNEKIETESEYIQHSRNKNITYCFYNVSIGKYDSKLCPNLPIFKTIELGNRCIPDLKEISNETLNKLPQQMLDLINSDFIRVSITNFYQQLPRVALLSVAALIITVLLVFLLRYIAKLMVILVLVLVSTGFIALTTFLWFKFHNLVKINSHEKYIFPIFKAEFEAKNVYLFYSILATIITAILLLVIIVLRKRIALIIQLFAEAQKALAAMPFLFTMPIFTFIILAMFLTYWLITAFMIYSFGDYDSSKLVLFNHEFDKNQLSKIFWVYHIIGVIWITEFIFSCQSMVIASSVAKWYFTRDKSTLKAPICTSVTHLAVYHLGSMALGSFLITLIRFPRYCLMYFKDKIKASNSSVAEYCSKICICCLWCLEKFMLFVNYNAYTVIAIEGSSFCSAAQKALSVIFENALRFAAINSVGDFVLFLSKIIVSALTLLISVFAFEVPINQLEELRFQILPMLLVLVISFLIAHCFFAIYEMVIDSLLICFCIDCRVNDGSPERPYYMSSSLKKFADENKFSILVEHN